MKLSILAPVAVAALTAAAGCSKPDQPAQTGRTTTTQPAANDADNTKRNERDRQGASATPFDQGESEADRNLTQQIRKAVVGDDSLSMTAHNVKIITKDGVVTLRGPVKSEAEKSSVAAKAKQVSGVTRVDNQLEVDTKLFPGGTIMNKAVFCIATSRSQAELIVDRLRLAGFSSNDVSVLFPDSGGTRDFAVEHHTKAPEGAATGAGTGGVVGAGLGWLAGIGALAIPGLGPFIAAGPIMAALSGAAVGAAVGGLTGALVGMGIPEFEAKRYEGRVKSGGILISVHTESSEEVARAKDIFKDAGGQDIASTTETKGEDVTATHHTYRRV